MDASPPLLSPFAISATLERTPAPGPRVGAICRVLVAQQTEREAVARVRLESSVGAKLTRRQRNGRRDSRRFTSRRVWQIVHTVRCGGGAGTEGGGGEGERGKAKFRVVWYFAYRSQSIRLSVGLSVCLAVWLSVGLSCLPNCILDRPTTWIVD